MGAVSLVMSAKGARQASTFFFEKKNQKSFHPPAPSLARRNRRKSLFASFSSEKEDSFFLPYPAPAWF
jgi:hypothetical protein